MLEFTHSGVWDSECREAFVWLQGVGFRERREPSSGTIIAPATEELRWALLVERLFDVDFQLLKITGPPVMSVQRWLCHSGVLHSGHV